MGKTWINNIIFLKAKGPIHQSIARWILFVSIVIALLANVIANDKPLFCRCRGVNQWPAFLEIIQSIGVRKSTFIDYSTCTARIMPLIPFAAHTIDPGGSGYAPPGHRSTLSYRYIHWLGTDALGRDVLAGMVYGARYAWIIGVGATFIAALGGIFIGMAAGYWKNERLTSNLLQILLIGIWMGLGTYYFQVFSWLWEGVAWITIELVLLFIWFIVGRWIWRASQKKGRSFYIPVDQIIMRVIDLFESFPKLFLIMALMVVLVRPSLLTLMSMIALVRWPLFVQISRAETLKESTSNYVTAAQNLGVSSTSILFKHIWPNIKPTLIVTSIFSISASILLEASLSFIGLGLRLERTTWGSLLNEGRQYLPGWWLSVFPGLAIFIVLLCLNWAYERKDTLSSRIE